MFPLYVMEVYVTRFIQPDSQQQLSIYSNNLHTEPS